MTPVIDGFTPYARGIQTHDVWCRRGERTKKPIAPVAALRWLLL